MIRNCWRKSDAAVPNDPTILTQDLSRNYRKRSLALWSERYSKGDREFFLVASASSPYEIPRCFRCGHTGVAPTRRLHAAGAPTVQLPTHTHCRSNAGIRRPRHIRVRVRHQPRLPARAEVGQYESLSSARIRLLRPRVELCKA
jgi:hypothetical protein